MTERMLRRFVKTAKENKARGLVIWANWTLKDEYKGLLNQGSANYEDIMAHLADGEVHSVDLKWNNLKMPGYMAVPVEKLSEQEFFNKILDESKRFHGPITLIGTCFA